MPGGTLKGKARPLLKVGGPIRHALCSRSEIRPDRIVVDQVARSIGQFNGAVAVSRYLSLYRIAVRSAFATQKELKSWDFDRY